MNTAMLGASCPTSTTPRPGTSLFGVWSCTARLVVGDDRVLAAATDDLAALLDRVDLAASRFRVDSELSIANSRAGRPTPVSRLLTDLVAAALDSAAQSGGTVDPTVGLAMNAIGYDRTIQSIAIDDRTIQSIAIDDRTIQSIAIDDRPIVVGAAGAARSWRDVRLDRQTGLLTVPVGCALDLGATAKAFTADYAARTLHARYDTPVLVELGGDLAVAGSLPGGWPIWVAEREGGNGQSVTITRGGLATSTTTLRQWRRGGVPVHHIIDPSTGRPANGAWRTVSVFAESALAANTASTAAIVLGSGAVEWMTSRGIAARLIDHIGQQTSTPGWPLDDVRPAR